MLFSPDGPEVPPDADALRSAIGEPTQRMHIITAPPPRVEARAVLVYQQQPRRPWRLLVFVAVLAALTVGVVLGQTAAWQPLARGSTAQAAVAPTPMTAPLGSGAAQVFTLTGDATSVRIVSADLPGQLYSITTTGQLTGTTLALSGASAEIRLNRSVRWTLRLQAFAADEEIDMRAGGLAGLTVAGAVTHAALQLPTPSAATVKLAFTGAVHALSLATTPTIPVRVRLGAGADLSVGGGRTLHTVKAGTTLTPATWTKSKHRYDATATARIGSLVVS